MKKIKRQGNLYSVLADDIEHQIQTGILKIGDKLPSLRSICHERGVSMNTAIRSYYELELRGLIESNPRSGYKVAYSRHKFLDLVGASQPKKVRRANSMNEIMEMMVENFANTKFKLSSANLDADLVPIKRLNAAIMKATETLDDSGVTYNSGGNLRLRTQLAKRALAWGGKLKSDDIVTTAGSIDGVAFCLMALCKSGDSIAVESPVYFGILRLAHSLGLNVIELPTHPVEGMDMDALEKLMRQRKIKLCILVSNFSNPLGSCMPDKNKRLVAEMAEKYDVAVVEDDVYGDLFFKGNRPKTIKTFDKGGNVIWCGSFSKTLVSGYRVGWLAPGKYMKEIERVKLYHTLYSSTITHEAIGLFLEMGKYDNHLRELRTKLYGNYLNLQRCLSEYFPEETKVSYPQGGMNLWIQFGKNFDALELYNKAVVRKISITPGRVFTLQNQYNNCIKLSFGMNWNEEYESAFRILGGLARKISTSI